MDQLCRLDINEDDILRTKIVLIKFLIDIVVLHIVLDGRVTNFNVDHLTKEEISVLPNSNFSRQIAMHFHTKFLRDVETMVTLTRREF